MSFEKISKIYKYFMIGYIILLLFLGIMLPISKNQNVNIWVEIIFLLPYITLAVLAIILANKKKKYAGIIGIIMALPSVIGVVTNLFYFSNLIKIVFSLDFVACVIMLIISILYTIKAFKKK